VLIYRLPKRENFVNSRSYCPNCKRTLNWYDLIPILSFLILRGRCRNCDKKISWTYPLIELVSGLIFVFSYLNFASYGSMYLIANIFLLEILLILFMTDLKQMILPDSAILSGIVVFLLVGVFELFSISARSFGVLTLSHLIAAVAFFIFFLAIWFLSKGTWLGLGDGKLMFLIGLIFGVSSLLIFYLAIIMGSVLALVLMAFRKVNLKSKLPLGSFICLSAAIFIFFSNVIMNKVEFLSQIINIWK
jgi:leader peptidase (prepilin peptidase) / N-methyltransferase